MLKVVDPWMLQSVNGFTCNAIRILCFEYIWNVIKLSNKVKLDFCEALYPSLVVNVQMAEFNTQHKDSYTSSSRLMKLILRWSTYNDHYFMIMPSHWRDSVKFHSRLPIPTWIRFCMSHGEITPQSWRFFSRVLYNIQWWSSAIHGSSPINTFILFPILHTTKGPISGKATVNASQIIETFFSSKRRLQKHSSNVRFPKYLLIITRLQKIWLTVSHKKFFAANAWKKKYKFYFPIHSVFLG